MRTCLFLAALFFLNSFANAGESRTWKTADGKNQVEAEFVKLEVDIVHLRRADNGGVAKVPLGVLSDSDKAYLRQLQGGAPAANRPAGWSVLAGASKAGLPEFQPLTLGGVPVFGTLPPAFTTQEERNRQGREEGRIRILLAHAAAPQCFSEAQAALDKAGLAEASKNHQSDFGLLQQAIEVFGSLEERRTHGDAVHKPQDEFAAADTLKKLFAKYDRSLAAIAPTAPLEIAFVRPVNLGSYDRETESFTWSTGGRSGDPLKYESWGPAFNYFQFNYDDNAQIPASLKLPLEDARALVSKLGGTEATLAARYRLTKLWNENEGRDRFGYRIRGANVELVAMSLYSNSDPKRPVYSWPVQPPYVEPEEPTTEEGEENDLAGLPQTNSAPANNEELFKRLGVETNNGRVVIYDRSVMLSKTSTPYFQGGRPTREAESLRKLFDLVELELDDLFLEVHGPRIAHNYLPKGESSKYIEVKAQYPTGFVDARWKGASTAEQNRSRESFLGAHGEKFTASGVQFPLQIVAVFPVGVGPYAQELGGFVLGDVKWLDWMLVPGRVEQLTNAIKENRHSYPPVQEATERGFVMQGPLSGTAIGLQYLTLPVPKVIPWVWRMEPAEGDRTVAKLRSRQGYLAAVIDLDPLKFDPAVTGGGASAMLKQAGIPVDERASQLGFTTFAPQVRSLALYSDLKLRTKVADFAVPETTPSVLAAGMPQDPTARESIVIGRHDDYLLMLKYFTEPLSEAGWRSLGEKQSARDLAYYQFAPGELPPHALPLSPFPVGYRPFFPYTGGVSIQPDGFLNYLPKLQEWYQQQVQTLPKKAHLPFRLEVEATAAGEPKVSVARAGYETSDLRALRARLGQKGYDPGQLAEPGTLGIGGYVSSLSVGDSTSYRPYYLFPNLLEEYLPTLSPAQAAAALGGEAKVQLAGYFDVEIGGAEVLPTEHTKHGLVLSLKPTHVTLLSAGGEKILINEDLQVQPREAAPDPANVAGQNTGPPLRNNSGEQPVPVRGDPFDLKTFDSSAGPDILDVKLGMPFAEADKKIREKIKVASMMIGSADDAQPTPYRNVRLYKSEDGKQHIKLYLSPVPDNNQVIGMVRWMEDSADKITFASASKWMQEKYGDPDESDDKLQVAVWSKYPHKSGWVGRTEDRAGASPLRLTWTEAAAENKPEQQATPAEKARTWTIYPSVPERRETFEATLVLPFRFEAIQLKRQDSGDTVTVHYNYLSTADQSYVYQNYLPKAVVRPGVAASSVPSATPGLYFAAAGIDLKDNVAGYEIYKPIILMEVAEGQVSRQVQFGGGNPLGGGVLPGGGVGIGGKPPQQMIIRLYDLRYAGAHYATWLEFEQNKPVPELDFAQ